MATEAVHPISLKELEAIKDLIVAARYYARLNKFPKLEQKLCDVLIDAITTLEQLKGDLNLQAATPPLSGLYNPRKES